MKSTSYNFLSYVSLGIYIGLIAFGIYFTTFVTMSAQTISEKGLFLALGLAFIAIGGSSLSSQWNFKKLDEIQQKIVDIDNKLNN